MVARCDLREAKANETECAVQAMSTLLPSGTIELDLHHHKDVKDIGKRHDLGIRRHCVLRGHCCAGNFGHRLMKQEMMRSPKQKICSPPDVSMDAKRTVKHYEVASVLCSREASALGYGAELGKQLLPFVESLYCTFQEVLMSAF